MMMMNRKGKTTTQEKPAGLTRLRNARYNLELFRYLIDQTNDAIFVIDPDTGRFLDVNARACHNLGYKREELLKMCVPAVETIIPDISAWKARVAEIKKAVHAVREGIQKRKDNTTFPVEVNSTYVSNGNMDYVVAIARDITERKEAEEELKNALRRVEEERARSEAIIAAIGDGISIQGRDFRILYQNEIAINMAGSHIGEYCYKAYEGMEQTCDKCPVALSFKDGKIHTTERAVPTDKGVTYLEITTSALRDSEGKIIAGIEVVRDVTERKKLEEEILSNKRDWEDAFNTITDMITVHDRDFNIIRANKAAEKILGLPFLEKTADAKCFKYYHGTAKPPEGCPSCSCLQTGIPATFELFEPNLNMFIEIRAIPRLDSNNNLVGLIHVVRDVTERKNAEERIQRQIQKLSSLRSIDLAITSSLDIRVTLRVFIDHVVTQLGVNAADVLLLNPQTRVLEYAAGQGFRTDALKHSRLRLGEGYAGTAALENRIVSVPDLKEEGTGFKRLGLLEGEDFISYHGVPLVAKGHIKGVLEIFHRSPLQPDEEWFEFLDSLALQAAVAIDNNSLFYDLERSNMELSLAYDNTIEGWSRALDYRDKETEGHSKRVTELTMKIAHEMGINEEELVHVRRGALLHDIGKMGIPDSILLKPGTLTDEEWKVMRQHPVYSYELLYPIVYLRRALDIPYCHHEKWDGSGYPRGLRGEQIPLCARIFAVVDVWDALRSNRPYRPAWSEDKIKEYILSLSGIQFDPKVVETFIRAIAWGRD